jgi:hypothetical protein
MIYMQKEFEDTKGVIRIRKSKVRQHNGQKKKGKRTNNDLQTEDRVTLTLLTNGGELRYSGRVNSSCSTIGTRRTGTQISQTNRELITGKVIPTTKKIRCYDIYIGKYKIYLYELQNLTFSTTSSLYM